MPTNLRYLDFYKQVDLDAVYDELGWVPESTDGVEDKGFCPDVWSLHKHGDTTGKFAFNRDKRVYNCWVCGGGTLLDLVMAAKSVPYQEATDWLFQFTKPSDQTSEQFYEEIERMLHSDDPPVKKPLPYFNERVLEPWDIHHKWFTDRGIENSVREFFKCGYNPTAREYSAKDGVYEGEAIILPHFWDGRLVGWQSRWLDEARPRWVGKYTNTSSFPRHQTVFGYDFCKTIPKQPIVVESTTTALMLISRGYPAIATFGGQVTPEQLKLLRIFQKGVILAPDNDSVGKEWIGKATEALLRYIPLLGVPLVQGSGSDLGDLQPEELPTHLQGIYAILAHNR